MTDRVLSIRGARQHNLKNIDLDIPKDKFVVMTGVSGSGKSSLAFDTIYAEGQRRYVESLSSYARQFLGLMDKPEVDRIDGLSPSISIDQKTVSHNPRSTVGTTTEIYDYLRVLFARVGHPHCPNDGTEITKLATDEIVAQILLELTQAVTSHKPAPLTFEILSPVVRERKGEFLDLFKNLTSKGYNYAYIDGTPFDLTKGVSLLKANKHSVSARIDRLSTSYQELKKSESLPTLRSRLATAVEQACDLSDGLVILRLGKVEQLYSQNYACPKCGQSLPEIEPRTFSFNSPLGACETCKGLGTVEHIDAGRIINPRLSYKEGGILPMNRVALIETWYTRLVETVAKEEDINLSIPLGTLAQDKLKLLLYGSGKEYKVVGNNLQGKVTAIHEVWDGIIPRLEHRYYDSTSDWVRGDLHKYFAVEVCPSCQGAKLKKEVLAITIDGFNITHLTELSVKDLLSYLETELPKKLSPVEQQIGAGILKEVVSRLLFLDNVGLSYLELSRASRTLSGGEQQRIRLASQIGTGLTGVLYVLDEPSIGLHSRDVDALISSLRRLVTLGNTLIVVEHDEETIRAADHLIELGPLAGAGGGRLIAEGTVAEVMQNKDSLTGQYLSGNKAIELESRELTTHLGELTLRGANENNLKNLTITLPLGNLIGITGVSGSGKSTLITDTLYPALKYYVQGEWQDKIGCYDRLDGYQYVKSVYLVDQAPIGRTPRSNPATYVGFFDEIRDIFASTPDARLKGFKKGRFSFNIKGGRCEKCQGGGSLKIEMQFLPDVYVQCDACGGRRYNQETLEVRFKDKTIFDVLAMTIEEAAQFFRAHSHIRRKLELLIEVGLGYLTVGQPAPTLSGGEAQRIKLASELSRREGGSTVYILDEPTTGLHFDDCRKLLHTLRRLVDMGNTVIVIEHNLDIIKNCQYLADLGPEGGVAGGNLLYQGVTKGIVKIKKSYTGQYLKKYL